MNAHQCYGRSTIARIVFKEVQWKVKMKVGIVIEIGGKEVVEKEKVL